VKPSNSRAAKLALALVCLGVAAPAAIASGGVNLPFNTLLSQIAGWMTGQAAVWIGTIALAAAAFVWMFLRHERGADFAFRALLGTSIAIFSVEIIGTLVGNGAML
jgi:type IV secretory pathway VirB2 component (pilin)